MRSSIDIIDFQINGDPSEGYLAIMECGKQVPFDIKRTFVTYQTPELVERGGHAHHETQMILVAVHGEITVMTEDQSGTIETTKLNSPSQGLYMPPLCWHTIRYSEDAVQVALASTLYDPVDYIRDYRAFVEFCKPYRS